MSKSNQHRSHFIMSTRTSLKQAKTTYIISVQQRPCHPWFISAIGNYRYIYDNQFASISSLSHRYHCARYTLVSIYQKQPNNIFIKFFAFFYVKDQLFVAECKKFRENSMAAKSNEFAVQLNGLRSHVNWLFTCKFVSEQHFYEQSFR